MFKDKVLMITGGTGSFGNAVLKHFINNGVGLRQLMDIGMYSIKNYEFVDWDKLFNYANEFNISTFIHCIYSVLEDFYNVKMRDINYPKHLIDKLDYTDF